MTEETVYIADKTASISQKIYSRSASARHFMLKDRHDGGGVIYPAFNSQIFFFSFLINNENVYCSALSR